MRQADSAAGDVEDFAIHVPGLRRAKPDGHRRDVFRRVQVRNLRLAQLNRLATARRLPLSTALGNTGTGTQLARRVRHALRHAGLSAGCDGVAGDTVTAEVARDYTRERRDTALGGTVVRLAGATLEAGN